MTHAQQQLVDEWKEVYIDCIPMLLEHYHDPRDVAAKARGIADAAIEVLEERTAEMRAGFEAERAIDIGAASGRVQA